MHTAVVVPGHAHQGRISDVCRALVREAERVASATAVDVVVFSGFARNGGETEADQMKAAWRGPAVELVTERTASVTVENALRTLPLLLERGIEHAFVVCAPLHVYRARFFFRRIYGARGIVTDYRVARVPRTLSALAWEIGAATALRRQLRVARDELAHL